MSGFEQLSEEIVHEGPVFSVGIAEVRAPDGRVMRREHVRHPGAVIVVPVVDGDVVLVRQYRSAVDQEILEVPAGKRDVEGEPPDQTAARELREEVGLVAGELTLLTRFFNTPGFSDEYSYCYLATSCRAVPVAHDGIEEEHMTVERVPLDEAAELARSGVIEDAKSIIAILLAEHALGS